MAANSQNRDLLVSQLAWQRDMGIDEILLDVPAPEDAVTMAALAPSRRIGNLRPPDSAPKRRPPRQRLYA